MKPTNVVILGASGMLGAMVLDVFAADSNFSLTATIRNKESAKVLQGHYPKVEWRFFDAETVDSSQITAALDGADWVVNCIGVIKPYIHDDNPSEIERAIRINALFPHVLGKIASQQGTQMIQIATDCVYSGSKGKYRESDCHDALDVYGKTKSLGELFRHRVHSLRCSIIGPEPKSYISLLEWFLHQPTNAQVNGFTNHEWNGISTLHFARLCRGIISSSRDLPRMHHITPTGSVSKAEMLHCFASAYDRLDIHITPVEAQTVIDRTLATENETLNCDLWQKAGYLTPPTVPEMIVEMADYRCAWLGERS